MTGTGEGQHGNQQLEERMETVRKEESGGGGDRIMFWPH